MPDLSPPVLIGLARFDDGPTPNRIYLQYDKALTVANIQPGNFFNIRFDNTEWDTLFAFAGSPGFENVVILEVANAGLDVGTSEMSYNAAHFEPKIRSLAGVPAASFTDLEIDSV